MLPLWGTSRLCRILCCTLSRPSADGPYLAGKKPNSIYLNASILNTGGEECRHKFHPVQIVILGSGSSPLGWIPARHGTAQQCCWAHPLMQNWTSQWTTLPRQQSPQRKPPTDVNTDDLECWWSELKLYTRSFLHEWSLAREGEDGRAGGGGAVRWGCVKSGDSLRWSPAGQRPCRDTRQQRETQIPPESVAESSWNPKIIVPAQTRLGQNRWLRGSPGFNFRRTAVGSPVMFTTHTDTRTHTHSMALCMHCKLCPCRLKGFCSRVFCCCFLFSW